MSTEYVFPQLEYHYRNKYEISNLNEIMTKPSLQTSELIKEESKDTLVYNNSIFNLLFNDVYNFNDYYYTTEDLSVNEMTSEFKYTTNGTFIKAKIINHITSENLFNINNEDITMLNLLLDYRKGITITLPSTNLSYYNTELSKLIFLYLYYKTTGNKNIGYVEPICNENSNILNLTYEDYIVREMYKGLRGY